MEEDAYKKWIENCNIKLPCQKMMLSILENNYNIQILKQYLSPMLDIDFPIDAIRDEIDFFLKKNVDSIFDSWFGKNLTSKYNEIKEVEDHLSIILAYREANKEITPSVIEKSINKPSYLTTILVLDKRIDSKLFKDVDKKILNIQKYDEIIHILSYIDRLQNEPVIIQMNETIENNIKQLETKSKNLKEFQIDRENIIEEIIKDINFIINKYHKHNKSNNNKTNQPSVEKKQFSTKYTHDKLKKIFRKSMDKGLFKDDTRLEDFLYVFGGGIKPKDFNKLDWIITAKSKSVNKRLLIYYFMKIYNLKRDYVRSPFIQFINERVKAGDRIIELGSKPDLEYKPEELKGIFPE